MVKDMTRYSQKILSFLSVLRRIPSAKRIPIIGLPKDALRDGARRHRPLFARIPPLYQRSPTPGSSNPVQRQRRDSGASGQSCSAFSPRELVSGYFCPSLNPHISSAEVSHAKVFDTYPAPAFRLSAA